MQNIIRLCVFCQPIIHRFYAHSKDLRLLNGVLLSEVRGKHLEELLLQHISPYLTHRSGLQFGHHLKHH